MAAHATRLEAAGRAAGAVAHDLSNALGGVLGWASLLVDDPKPPAEDVKEAAAAFVESAELAATLVLQLEPRIPDMGPEMQSTNVGRQIAQSRKVLQRRLREHGALRLSTEAECHAPIGADDLPRVLLNLTVNARDAMPKGGTLSFCCRRDESTSEVVLKIEDDGIGMSKKCGSGCSRPSSPRRVRVRAVAQIVDASGGSIDVASELGQGTRFTLRWPCVVARAPREQPVVLCSGHLPKDIEVVARSGEVRFLPKPFSPADLVQALREELEFVEHRSGTRDEVGRADPMRSPDSAGMPCQAGRSSRPSA